jgi:hypothetical protein
MKKGVDAGVFSLHAEAVDNKTLTHCLLDK